MEQGKAYVYGQQGDKVLSWEDGVFKEKKFNENDKYLLHQPDEERASIEFALAEMTYSDKLPTPIGIFKNEDYCWITTSRGCMSTELDCYNLGLKFSEDKSIILDVDKEEELQTLNIFYLDNYQQFV